MRTYGHSIYGARNGAISKYTQNFNVAMRSLASLIYAIEVSIDKYFPNANVTTGIVAKARAVARLPPVLFVRLTWRQRYPGTFFDDQNVLHRLQIKGLYLEFGWDYCNDPLFKDALGIGLITQVSLGRDVL